jgi:hypothetical protein
VIRSVLECAEDFQSYSPVSVSVRNCLWWKERVTTASCAGVCWNAPECAGVGHSLGTNCLAPTELPHPPVVAPTVGL